MTFEITRSKNAATESEKENLIEILDKHHIYAKNVRDQMVKDMDRAKVDNKIRCLIVDLQKVLIIPRAQTNLIYYTRNFNCYNFNIHKNDNKNFHFWTEIDGGRGSREIGSCLIKYFENSWDESCEEIII